MSVEGSEGNGLSTTLLFANFFRDAGDKDVYVHFIA